MLLIAVCVVMFVQVSSRNLGQHIKKIQTDIHTY